jgi:hypothetical protein
MSAEVVSWTVKGSSQRHYGVTLDDGQVEYTHSVPASIMRPGRVLTLDPATVWLRREVAR